MQAYYINLDTAIARMNSIKSCISNAALPFEFARFNALRGDFSEINFGNLSVGQIGCWRSHLAIIEQNLNNDEDLLIIEDDEYFDSTLVHLPRIISDLHDQDWDVLYLDATLTEIEDYLLLMRYLVGMMETDLSPKAFLLPNTFTAFGTHGYLINGSKKNKVLDWLKSCIPNEKPIDNAYCKGIQSDSLNSFIVLPLILSPSDETSISTINSVQHPLDDFWMRYRKVISARNIVENYQKYPALLMDEIKQIITARMNFHVDKKFLP